MTSIQQYGLSSDRICDPHGLNIDHLECPICHEIFWKPVACQSCETSFCSVCIHQWLVDHPAQCPNRCKTYIQRKCPPILAKLLAELQIACFYESNGCNQVLSYEALDKHEIECSYQYQQCSGCQTNILKKNFDNHQNNCASIEVTCENCKLVYKRADAISQHTEIICLKEQIRQARTESKENKDEIHELNAELNEIRLLYPLITKMKITFDDLPIAADRSQLISNMYRGFIWTDIAYGNELFWKIRQPKSGYVTSFKRGGSRHIAFFKDNASISAGSRNHKFTFVSVTACAAWNDDLKLTIMGYQNSTSTNMHTTNLLYGKPQLILLRWKDVDKVIFTSSGGTPHPGNGGATGSQ
ncbi:unnamed protein product, partial [Rotaria sordida]